MTKHAGKNRAGRTGKTPADKSTRTTQSPPRTRAPFPKRRMLTMAFAALCLLGYAAWQSFQAPTPDNSKPAVASNSTPVATSANADFSKFIGKWKRSDGDYTLEIRSIAPDGKADAGYFNPQPIKVGKAEATTDGSQAKVYVELQDVNYPGSAYTLIHDAGIDQLLGTYYQATEQQTYQVMFQRAP